MSVRKPKDATAPAGPAPGPTPKDANATLSPGPAPDTQQEKITRAASVLKNIYDDVQTIKKNNHHFKQDRKTATMKECRERMEMLYSDFNRCGWRSG